MQRRLLAQQATTGKNLQRQIMKAKDQHEEMEAQVAAAATDADIHKLRGAFIVFNEARLADDAISSAPHGTALTNTCHCLLSQMSTEAPVFQSHNRRISGHADWALWPLLRGRWYIKGSSRSCSAMPLVAC